MLKWNIEVSILDIGISLFNSTTLKDTLKVVNNKQVDNFSRCLRLEYPHTTSISLRLLMLQVCDNFLQIDCSSWKKKSKYFVIVVVTIVLLIMWC